MSEFKPTAAQYAAIHTRGSAVLVSAGAGSGKTRVLTERLMSYITDPENPADIDSFLIITFTRAAAGELRGRIMEELAQALARDPGSRRLRRQSALCQKAQIGTIHSFCARVLREYSHVLGLAPDFKIADEDGAAAMKRAALERVLDACYEKPEAHPGFTLLADTVGAGRDDSRLAELVLTLHSKMQSHARPEKWAREQVELLHAGASDAAETPWGAEVLNAAKRSAAYWSGELDRLMALMQGEEKICKAYLPALSEAGDTIRELQRRLNMGWDKAREILPIIFPRLGILRNPPDPELAARVKSRWDACKKDMKALGDSLYSDSEKLLREMAYTAPAMEALLELTLDFDREFSKEKRRAALVDYADLEHMTARLLTEEDGSPSALAVQLSQRYTEIMVDEYQDVSRVQDAIFHAISREGKNLFLVGDVKQSIYRFRLADPEIFTEKYLRYADDDSAAPGEPRRIILSENFRSRREVLEAANGVFGCCMSRGLGDIDYDDKARLIPGAQYPGSVPPPELMLLELSGAAEDEESPDKTALEAAMVAEKIRELVDSGETVTDHGVQRPMEYGDIAILLRSVNNVGGVYRRTLAQYGIPVGSGQGGGFFSSVEISAMMSMLAVIDNPHQDIPLIAVLRSPCFGFSADELSAIRTEDREQDFYTALCAAAEHNEKCRSFGEKLSELRNMAADMSAGELVWRLLDELDMLALCSAMSDGEQRRANLMELIELAQRFESSGYRGLHRFVLWLRRQAEKGLEPSTGGAEESAVQIMSIHKSKGMEFPVVFLCDTARRFNKQDSRDTVLVHPELGLGPKVTDLERRVEYPSLARNAIKLRLEREMLSEEMRLLYVALTRARERLFLTAAVKNAEQLVEKTGAAVSLPMSPELLASASSPLVWLLNAQCVCGDRLKLCIRNPGRKESAAAEKRAEENRADEESRKELERRLSFSYPHREAEALPSKVTATGLKGHRQLDEDAEDISPKGERSFRMPDFTRKDKPVTGAERGTATHLVLQYMDFARTGSLEEIRGEIERLRAARFLSDREAAAVDAGAICKLFASELGKRMLGADSIQREFKFSLLCDAGQIFGSAAGEQLLLQGVVDCCIEEKGQLTVIDYKTDRVKTPEEIAQRARHYTIQLQSYAAAMERICGKPVKECVLYFLNAGKAVSLLPEK